jgi:hypothetical protein
MDDKPANEEGIITAARKYATKHCNKNIIETIHSDCNRRSLKNTKQLKSGILTHFWFIASSAPEISSFTRYQTLIFLFVNPPRGITRNKYLW